MAEDSERFVAALLSMGCTPGVAGDVLEPSGLTSQNYDAACEWHTDLQGTVKKASWVKWLRI